MIGSVIPSVIPGFLPIDISAEDYFNFSMIDAES